jgi:hypothetical protein
MIVQLQDLTLLKRMLSVTDQYAASGCDWDRMKADEKYVDVNGLQGE